MCIDFSHMLLCSTRYLYVLWFRLGFNFLHLGQIVNIKYLIKLESQPKL